MGDFHFQAEWPGDLARRALIVLIINVKPRATDAPYRSLARVIKKSRFLAPHLSLSYFSSATADDRSAVVRMHRDRCVAHTHVSRLRPRRAEPSRAEPSRAEARRGERAVIGDFPAMERERATRGTNRGSPRGIPRKTRSHQDSRMLALCCTDLTYWPMQLPCTINRDPARGARTLEKKERKKGRKEKRGGRDARPTKRRSGRRRRGEERCG